MIKAVLWDLDGTLIDSEAVHYRAIVEANRKIGLSVGDQFDLAPGLEGESVFDSLCKQAQYPHRDKYGIWYQHTIDYAVNRISEAKLIRQNIAWVKELAKCGVVQVIVSNSDSRFVTKALEVMSLRHCFQGICSRDKVAKGKPDPALYQYALDLLSIDCRQAIAIEDSNSGLLAANQANIVTLAYNNPNALADYQLSNDKQRRQNLFEQLFD